MQGQDNQKNLLLAIILSIGVVFGWQMLFPNPRAKLEQKNTQQTSQTTTAPEATAPGSLAPPAPGVQAPSGPAKAPAPTRDAALAASPRVGIDTPSLKGSIALKGGRIDDLSLVKYRETVDPNSPAVILLSPADSPTPYFAEFGWIAPAGSNVKLPDRDTVWQTEQPGSLTQDKPITLLWNNGQGLTFRRTVAVDPQYMFKVADQVENASGAPVTLFPYARVFREGTPHVQGYYILHEGLIGVLGDDGLNEITYANALKEGGSKTVDKAQGGWLGFTDKYWATALIPNQSETFAARMSGQQKSGEQRENFQADYRLDALTVAPGEKRTTESQMFAGARQVQLIEAYGAQYGIKKFDLLIDWGWFYFITKPLFYLISWLYGILGNFGLAILAVTVLVKAAFFPLANKSYESMAKMKKLQPEMERIRERFKDDKMRQQQELMGLYQKQKINPLAGCLPIVIQIPVFFALYKVLFVTIDMRHAPFFGWIKDLSAPDPTSIFNLFGLLPFVAPEFLHVGAWPILMGITMWLQMQLNPQQPDPMQQQIFNWMPVIFTFMLASFPVGLVIYWAWNNILSLTQQWLIMKKQGVEVPIIDNLKRNFAPVIGLLNRNKSASPPEPKPATVKPEVASVSGSIMTPEGTGGGTAAVASPPATVPTSGAPAAARRTTNPSRRRKR